MYVFLVCQVDERAGEEGVDPQLTKLKYRRGDEAVAANGGLIALQGVQDQLD